IVLGRFGKKFQRDRLAQDEIVSPKNLTHPTFTKTGDDSIPAGQKGAGRKPLVRVTWNPLTDGRDRFGYCFDLFGVVCHKLLVFRIPKTPPCFMDVKLHMLASPPAASHSEDSLIRHA